MVVKIVDREREIARLRELAAHPPAFAVLRGRRRVGKTFLLRVALTGDRVLHLQAEEQPRALQLEAFARECAGLLPGAPPLAFGDWGEAFALIERQANEGGPLVMILDEFQYLARADPGLLSTIQRAWDHWDRNGIEVTLILCGSALSFMEGTLGAGKPTYGRSAYRPLVLPLSYRDCAAFAPRGLAADDLIERFAVLGGTPQYQRWAGVRPLDDVIREIVLPPDAPLHGEPENLIRQEEGIREPGPYFGVLQALAGGNSTTSSIAGRLEVKQQLASQFLARLQELGYITKMEPLEPRRRGRPRAYWKIGDPYFRFWFRYVFPNRSRLARGRITEVATEIRRDLATFVGPVFEDCCREWVARWSPLGRDAVEVGAWWSRRNDLEIDVVTVGKTTFGLLASCKWWTKLAGVNVLEELYAARATLGPEAARAKLAMFSRRGFTDELRARAEREGVTLVSAAGLFSG